MPSANTVALDSHADASLRYIRRSMEAATSLAIPGSAGIAMGIVGCGATVLSLVPELRDYWLSIWLVAAVLASGVGGLLVLRPASVRALALSGTPIRKFALCLLPSLFAGAVLTAVLGAHDSLQAVPAVWLLLYGCALMSASVPTTRTIGVMGASFTALGLIALLIPDEFQMLALGLGFGGLHIAFGCWIARGRHGSES